MHQIPLPGTNRKLEARQEFDLATLEEVAQISDGKSYLAEDTDALEAIFKTIDQLEKTEIFRSTIVEARDLFPWFLWPAVVIAIVSMVLRQTLLRTAP